MAFGRYYIRRNGTNGPAADTLSFQITSNGNPWKWAAVRGNKADNTSLQQITLTKTSAGVDLTVIVTANDRSLVNSFYEVAIGDDASSPTDAEVSPNGKPRQPQATIVQLNSSGWVMDRDPPPPPTGAFLPKVNL